jgi:adenylate cyclase
MEHKLAAMLHADVKGHSHLIGDDEVTTLRLLTAHFEMMATLVRHPGGRIAGSAGDSLLAEFPSVVAAVQCAVERQHELKDLNAALPVARWMEFRMGINVGVVRSR